MCAVPTYLIVTITDEASNYRENYFKSAWNKKSQITQQQQKVAFLTCAVALFESFNLIYLHLIAFSFSLFPSIINLKPSFLAIACI